MKSRPLRMLLWVALLLSIACCSHVRVTNAVPVDLSEPVLRNHVLLFGNYGSPSAPMHRASPPDANTRYVQLSNGSRFVCDTTSFEHHDPPPSTGFPLAHGVQAVLQSIMDVGQPCTHVVEEQYATVLCWNREVRHEVVAARTARVLGRYNRSATGNGAASDYWLGIDSFGPYAATAYGGGDACKYEKRPMETEIRFYCRYTELENPIPFLSLHESSQCNYVLRVLSNRFCGIPQLDHAIETETVQCRMLD